MSTIIVIEFAVYLLGMLGVGLYFARKHMDQKEFHLGGRKLPGWALALSERATGESAWLILGLSGLAFAEGLASIWTAAGCVLGIVVSWLWLSHKFREEALKYDSLTMCDYLATKFKKQGAFIRWYSAVIIIFFYGLYVVAQFSGGGKTVHQTLGLPVHWGILLTGLVVVLYSMAGGFSAVVYTDAIQAILMMLAFFVTPIVALVHIWQQDLSIARALTEASVQTGIGFNSLTGGLMGFTLGVMIFNHFSWFFGYMGGQPQLNARWMAMGSAKQVKIGQWIAIIWTIMAYAGVIMIGLTAITLYGPDAVADKEQILPFMLLKLMPAWLAGIVLTGAVAAMMSTASSQLLVATSTISEDILHKALKIKLSDKKLVLVSRLTILVVGLGSLALAFTSTKMIYTVVGWAWAGIGCSFAPAILLSFFWRKFNGYGVAGSLIGGSVTTVVWMTTGLDQVFTARAAAFIVAFLAALACTYAFAGKHKATGAA